LPLVVELPSFETSGIDEPEVGDELILVIDLFPLALQSLADFLDFLSAKDLPI
jgi:hypothetical protein